VQTQPANIYGGELNFVDGDGLGAQVLNNGAVAQGATTIVVDANTNISVGDVVEVEGVTAGTTVTNVNGTTITISAATTAAIADEHLNFIFTSRFRNFECWFYCRFY
jgi:hypothetical protein